MATDEQPETRTRRLVIQNLEVENFKSYAGRHRIGPFHKTFTAVIGPNGSGKSNVIDAMLFVFAKNAKKIRLDKLQELIHCSAKYPNLNHASVTVNFVEVEETEATRKDPTEINVVPRTELSIMREVVRSGQTQYYINGRKAPKGDVVTTLIAKGVDLEHNRFLILQGEVEQIALMKPKAEKEGEEGLLEYFDDLIGTNRFIAPIATAAKLADELQEERLAGLDVLKKVQGERDALEGAKNSTMGYVRKDNRLQKMLSVMCQLKMLEAEEELKEPRRVVAEYDAKLQAVQDDVTQCEADAETLSKQQLESKKELSKLNKEAAQLQEQKETAEENMAAAKAGVDEAEKARKKDGDKCKKLREDVKKCDLQIQDTERDIKIATSNVEEAREKLEKLEPALEAQTEDLQQALQPLRKKMDGKMRELAPWAEKVDAAEQSLKLAQERVEAGNEAVTKKQAERENLQRDLEAKDQRKLQVERHADELRDKIDKRRSAVEQMGAVEQKFRQAVAKKLSTNGQIEALKAEFREGESGDKVTQLLMGKRISGYHGPLRQLGTIDDRYDIAAGVAGGASWNFHVVDNETVASECLRTLREQGQGRATFIVLRQVERELSKRMENKFNLPPRAERLFDLIKPTQGKFAIAFYFAVKDTLVVNELTVARELGLGSGQRHRVVTLRGELVEPSGVLTGGGDQRLGGANLKARGQGMDKQRAKEQLIALQAELTQAVHDERELQAQIDALRNAMSSGSGHHDEDTLRKAEAEVRQLTAVIASMEQKQAALAKEVTALQSSGDAAKRMKELAAAVTAAEAALATARGNRTQYQDQVDTLQKQMDAVGGPEYAKLKENVEAERARAKDFEKRLSESRKAMQKFTLARDRKAKEVEELEASIQKAINAASDGNLEEVKRITKILEDVGEKLKAKKRACSDVEEVVQEFVDKISACADAKRKLTTRHQDLTRERSEHAEALGKKMEALQKYETKIEECTSKVKENVAEFGAETLPRGVKEDGDEEAKEEDDVRSESSDESVRDVDMSQYTTRVPEDTLGDYDFDHCRYTAQQLSQECRRLRDTIDFQCVAVWREKDKLFRAERAKYEDLHAKTLEAERNVDALKDERKKEFMKSFLIIQRKLKLMYQMLTTGGDAEVELVDVQDPFEGINFVVRPPKKSWKQVGNLSGGEKTLSSLALVFALHHVKPTPIYVMDEIDAALDFRNVSIVARYVLEQAVGAQFVIISLRNNMFELAHQLVGVCKVNDCSRSIPLNPNRIAKTIEAKVLAMQAMQAKRGTPGRPTRGSRALPPRQSQQLTPKANGHAPVLRSHNPNHPPVAEAKRSRLSGEEDALSSGEKRRRNEQNTNSTAEESQ